MVVRVDPDPSRVELRPTVTRALVLADPAPPRRPRIPRIPRLLQQTAFRRYWSAQTVSLFGDQITMLAVPLLAVLAIGAGPAEMGYLTAASLLPNLFFSLPAGAWLDRHSRRRQVMIIADLGRAGLLLAVPLLWWADVLNLPLLCVVAFLIGVLSVFFEVAHSQPVRRPRPATGLCGRQ